MFDGLINYSYEAQFNDNDIIELIGEEKHNEIISKDPKPLYKKFVLAHEGESRPKLLGIGQVVLKWGKEAIQKVSQLVNVGIQCTEGHTKDNTNKEGKETIAYVVGKKLESVNDKLRTVVALYFPDKQRSNYDVISMEASGVNVNKDYFVDGVKSILRIALGNSRKDKPAFSEARLIGEYQFFEEIKEQKAEKKIMTVLELKNIVREMGLFPSQLFDPKDIVGQTIKESDGRVVFVGGDDRVNALINKQIPQPTDYEKQIAEKENELKKYKEESTKYKTELYRNNTKPLVTKIIEEKKLTESQSKFIEKSLAEFNPNPEADHEEQARVWVEKQIGFLKLALESAGVESAGNVPKPIEPKEKDQKDKDIYI